jgi:hypothetical protein
VAKRKTPLGVVNLGGADPQVQQQAVGARIGQISEVGKTFVADVHTRVVQRLGGGNGERVFVKNS